MPYPLFQLGLAGAALRRQYGLEAAGIAGGLIDASELTGLQIDLYEAIEG